MTFTCGRRFDMFRPPSEADKDTWRERDGHEVCSYCGSYRPDLLLAELEAGTMKLGPTDKSYKVYVEKDGNHYYAKFYFQHFDKEQCQKFIDLWNAKRREIMSEPFYVYPFFMRPIRAEESR